MWGCACVHASMHMHDSCPATAHWQPPLLPHLHVLLIPQPPGCHGQPTHAPVQWTSHLATTCPRQPSRRHCCHTCTCCSFNNHLAAMGSPHAPQSNGPATWPPPAHDSPAAATAATLARAAHPTTTWLPWAAHTHHHPMNWPSRAQQPPCHYPTTLPLPRPNPPPPPPCSHMQGPT